MRAPLAAQKAWPAPRVSVLRKHSLGRTSARERTEKGRRLLSLLRTGSVPNRKDGCLCSITIPIFYYDVVIKRLPAPSWGGNVEPRQADLFALGIGHWRKRPVPLNDDTRAEGVARTPKRAALYPFKLETPEAAPVRTVVLNGPASPFRDCEFERARARINYKMVINSSEVRLDNREDSCFRGGGVILFAIAAERQHKRHNPTVSHLRGHRGYLYHGLCSYPNRKWVIELN